MKEGQGREPGASGSGEAPAGLQTADLRPCPGPVHQPTSACGLSSGSLPLSQGPGDPDIACCYRKAVHTQSQRNQRTEPGFGVLIIITVIKIIVRCI